MVALWLTRSEASKSGMNRAQNKNPFQHLDFIFMVWQINGNRDLLDIH